MVFAHRIVGVRAFQGHSMDVDHEAINWRLLTPQSFFEVFAKLPQFFHHGTTLELAPKLVEDGIHPGGDRGTRKVVMFSASETWDEKNVGGQRFNSECAVRVGAWELMWNYPC